MAFVLLGVQRLPSYACPLLIEFIRRTMGASFLLATAKISERPQLIQDFGSAVRKTWFLPEGLWHLRVVKNSVEGFMIPYETLDFRNQSKISDPKRLLSWMTLCGKRPLTVLQIPAGHKNLILRLDGVQGMGVETFLAEVRCRRAKILRDQHLPFLAPTDADERKKLEWLKKEEAITDEEHKELISQLGV